MNVSWTDIFTLWIESILCGVYMIIFGLFLLLRTTGNKQQVVVLTLMLLLSVAHVSCLPAKLLLSNHNASSHAMRAVHRFPFVMDTLWITCQLVSDSVFIHRCMAIWKYNVRVMLLPILTLLSATAVGYAGIYAEAAVIERRLHYADTDSRVHRFLVLQRILQVVTLALSTGTAIMLTTLHAYRISKATAEQKRLISSWFIIFDSGMLYTLSILLCSVIVFVCPRTKAVTFGYLTQVAGIVPTLTVVRQCLSERQPGAWWSSEPDFVLSTVVMTDPSMCGEYT